MPPPPPRAQAFLRYVLREYDEGCLTFARIPQLLLATCCVAGLAEIWSALLLLSPTPDAAQKLGARLSSLYWPMLAAGFSLALLYAAALGSSLLYRRRHPEIFAADQAESQAKEAAARRARLQQGL